MTAPTPTHAKLSFSARSRWAACPVSVPLSAGLPDKPSGAAAEGTAAHAVAEAFVRNHFGLAGANGVVEVPDFPPEFDPKGLKLADWQADLTRHGLGYQNFIVSLIGPATDAYIVLEHKVAAASIREQLFGKADCLIWIASTRTLIVVDYKYGFEPVEVGAVEDPNKQLEAYAIAAIDQTGVTPDRVILAVYQPRRHIGQAGQTLELPGAWYQEARMRIRTEARCVELATEGTDYTTPVPGKHCRYCRAKVKCGAPNQFAVAALKAYAQPATLQDMTDDEVVAVWGLRTAFKNFMEDIEERIGMLVKTGHAGLTVKTSQGRQMWGDPKLAAQTLLAIGRADLLQPVALSEALHAIPEAYREGLVKRSAPSTTITLVSKSDPNAVAAMFEKYAQKS